MKIQSMLIAILFGWVIGLQIRSVNTDHKLADLTYRADAWVLSLMEEIKYVEHTQADFIHQAENKNKGEHL